MALTIVGLGPGPRSYLSQAVQDMIKAADKVFLQSDFYPVAQTVAACATDLECLDDCYQTADDFDALNAQIAARIAESAAQCQTVFAVIGSATEGQSAVSVVLAECQARGIGTSLFAGVSLGAAALAAAGVSADNGFCSHFGKLDMLRMDVNIPQVICDLNSPLQASECKLQLLDLYPGEHVVHLVTAVEDALAVRSLPLSEIDRGIAYDICTSLVVPCLSFAARAR